MGDKVSVIFCDYRDVVAWASAGLLKSEASHTPIEGSE